MATFGTPSGGGWQSGLEALQQGLVEEAVAQLGAFVQAHPDSFEGNNFLGVALAQAGRHQEAIYYLQRATRLNPQSAQAHYNLGLACLGAQQNESARTAFQTALQLKPDHAQAQQALSALAPPAEGTPAWTAAPPPADLTATDMLRAAVFGLLAAVVGAFAWELFTYYTNIKFGLIAMFLGIGVGIAVSLGARGKSSAALQWLGAALAALGILFGEVLLLKDGLQDYVSKEQHVHVGFIHALIAAVIAFPKYATSGGISLMSLVFFAIGIYEGWKIPGRGQHKT